MAVIVLRTVKGIPLTIEEADANISNLNNELATKLNSSVYTANDILTKIKTVDGTGSGLDADLLDGLNSSITLPGGVDKSSIVARDSSGNFYANTMFANVVGNISGGSITNITDLAVADGGTGASTAEGARANLGIGSLATQNASNVNISGGSITNITDLAVADGGTGASTAEGARANLGIGSLGTQNANTVNITGGNIANINDLAVADGGTGVSFLPKNALIVGNDADAVQTVLPGNSGNVLLSNGVGWFSGRLPGIIGVNQSWQAVTRNFDTDYLNNTGRPIMLIGAFRRSVSSYLYVDVVIGGVPVPLAYTASGVYTAMSGSIIIPNNTTYRLTYGSGSAPVMSYVIYELR